MVRPTTLAAPANWRRHRPSLISTTCAPPKTPSAAVKPRPTAGAAPSSGSRFVVTAAPSRRTASPPKSIGCVSGVQAARSTMLRKRSRSARYSPSGAEADRYQPIRLLVRKRLQDNRVDDGEDRGVRADTESESQHRRDRERRRPPQRAHAELHVLHEVGDVLGALSRRLLSPVVVDERGAHVRDVAEALGRFAACVVGRHAERDVPLDAHLEVERELVVDVGRHVGTEESRETEIAAPARRAL